MSGRAPLRSARLWLSVLTAAVVAAVVWAAWPEVAAAVRSLDGVDPVVLSLLVPVQLLSFAATGEVLFSFLRARGELRGTHVRTAMRMSLEFNFVGHVMPSGGAVGIAYTSWRLAALGVPAQRATLAQLVRFAVTFASFAVMLALAALLLALRGHAAPPVLGAALLVGALAIGAIAVGLLALRRRRMLHRMAGRFGGALAAVFRRLGRRAPVDVAGMVRFADGLHRELREVLAAPRALRVPVAWSFLVNACDAGLFLVALAAFGVSADPALVFVAYGLATLMSMVVLTPNGVGGYEVAMVGVLVAGGVPAASAIAAIVLARVVLMTGTVVFGWAFYQHALLRSRGRLSHARMPPARP